jgi:hypothetical protein
LSETFSSVIEQFLFPNDIIRLAITFGPSPLREISKLVIL